MLADRWNRKKTMIYANLLLAIGLFPLLAVSGPGDVWIVYAVLVWEGAVQQFFSPAQRAMVPRLVADDQLPAANAINGQVGDIARLAGSALGGILAAVGGLATVTIADIASFFASAILLAGIRTSGSVIRESATRTRLATVATDLRAGPLLVTNTRILRGLMFFGLVTGLGEGIFATLVTPFVEHTLHGSSRQFGLFAAAQAIAGVAGGLLATSVSNRIPASRLLAFGAMAFGAVDLAIFLYPVVYVSLWPAVVGMIVAGLPSALAGAGMMTLLRRGVQDAFRGRLFGAFGAVQGLAVLIGTLAAGYLSGWLGTIPVLPATEDAEQRKESPSATIQRIARVADASANTDAFEAELVQVPAFIPRPFHDPQSGSPARRHRHGAVRKAGRRESQLATSARREAIARSFPYRSGRSRSRPSCAGDRPQGCVRAHRESARRGYPALRSPPMPPAAVSAR